MLTEPCAFLLTLPDQPVLAGTFADDEEDYGRTIVYPASWRPVLVNADVLSMFFTVRRTTMIIVQLFGVLLDLTQQLHNWEQ